MDLPNKTHGDKKMPYADFMSAVRNVSDSNGHQVTQKTWDEAVAIISSFAEIWDNAPDDKQFGCGLKNGHFLRCKEFLQDN